MENKYTNLSTASAARAQTADTALQFLKSLPFAGLAGDNPEQALKNIIEAIVKRLSADNGYILIENKNHAGLEPAAAAHRDADTETVNTFSTAVADRVMKTNNGILLNDAMNNKDFFGDPSLQRFNIKSVICIPTAAETTPTAVLYLDSLQEHCNWQQDDLKLLEPVAYCLWLALHVVQLQEEIAKNHRLAQAGQISLKISHSIKNILQLILGSTEVIDFGLRTNEIHRVKRSWDILKPNLERVRKFTLDMLDFSKERHLELGPCNFNAIIQSAIESLNSQLKQKKTKLHIRIDQQIPLIELDGERIHEMTANLILNAIDIVDDNTGVVIVETKYLQQENAVQLRVTDNGPGISDEARERLFLPFESTKNKLGTGLGLAIAKQIVEQHKAKIEIESEVGKGATFIVTLPAKIIKEN
jgi:signal transduction histidine kinase